MRWLLLWLWLLYLPGIAQELTLESEPAGARVFDAAENYLGTTPCILARDPRLSQVIYLQRAGYATARLRVQGSQRSARVVLEPNLPSTWLQRHAGLVATGLLLAAGAALGARRWVRRGLPPSIAGRTVGRYRVLEKVGEGSTASVFRLRGALAMKLFHSALRDPRDRERLRRELEVGMRLSHPNLLRVHDFGEWESRPYLVVDYVDGEPLSDRLSRGPLELETALSVLRDVTAALDAIHREGVVHRDVSPANIMLARDGRAFLTDFGLAVWTERPRVTATGTALGTPLYMAPESLLKRAANPRSDLYSLAVVLFEMLTGTILFEADDAYQVLAAHLHQAPPPLRERAPHLPEALQPVLDRALAKDPAARFASAGELLQAVEAAL